MAKNGNVANLQNNGASPKVCKRTTRAAEMSVTSFYGNKILEGGLCLRHHSISIPTTITTYSQKRLVCPPTNASFVFVFSFFLHLKICCFFLSFFSFNKIDNVSTGILTRCKKHMFYLFKWLITSIIAQHLSLKGLNK